MSKIILIAAQKGGVGKSTTATNLAVALATQGHMPLVVDADEQATTFAWWIERSRAFPDHALVQCEQEYGEVDHYIKQAAKGYEYVLIDAAGHDSIEMRTAMLACDTLLIPFRPSQADINTIPHMVKVVSHARKLNPALSAYAFLSAAPTVLNSKSLEQSKQVLDNYPEITLLTTVIYDRLSYINALSDGLGVVELEGKTLSEIKAKKEIISLLQEILHGYQTSNYLN